MPPVPAYAAGLPITQFLCNVATGWSVHLSFAKGIWPTAGSMKNYYIENGYFRFQHSSGITYWLAQDLSSISVSTSPNGSPMKFGYRISKEQYDYLYRIEYDFLNKVDAFEARCRYGQTSSSSSSFSRSLQEDIEECDRKIDAINRKSVERYTRQGNTPTKARGVCYAPDYTGGKYTYYCPECKKWGPHHVHYNLNGR